MSEPLEGAFHISLDQEFDSIDEAIAEVERLRAELARRDEQITAVRNRMLSYAMRPKERDWDLIRDIRMILDGAS